MARSGFVYALSEEIANMYAFDDPCYAAARDHASAKYRHMGQELVDYVCLFCHGTGHQIRKCPLARQFLDDAGIRRMAVFWRLLAPWYKPLEEHVRLLQRG